MQRRLPTFETRSSFITFLPDQTPSEEELAMGVDFSIEERGTEEAVHDLPRGANAVHDIQNRAALRYQFPPISPRSYEKSLYEIERSDSEAEETKEELIPAEFENEYGMRGRPKRETDDDVSSSKVSSEIHRKHLMRSGTGRSFTDLLSSPFRSFGTRQKEKEEDNIRRKYQPVISDYIDHDNFEKKRIDQASHDRYMGTFAFNLSAAKNLTATQANEVRVHSQMYPSVLVGYQICLLFPEDLPILSENLLDDQEEEEEGKEKNGDVAASSERKPATYENTDLVQSRGATPAPAVSVTTDPEHTPYSFESPAAPFHKLLNPPAVRERERSLAKADLSFPQPKSIGRVRGRSRNIGSLRGDRDTVTQALTERERQLASIMDIHTDIATVPERIRIVIGVEKKKDPLTGKNSSYYQLLRGDGDVETVQLKRGLRKPGAYFTVLRDVAADVEEAFLKAFEDDEDDEDGC